MAGTRLVVYKPQGFEQALRLISEWPERVRAMAAMITYQAAHKQYKMLEAKIPRKQEYKAYRLGLTISRVSGFRGDSYGHVVYLDLKNRLVRKVHVFNTLVYVKPRRALARVAPEVAVLAKYNPWTYETLPFKPSRQDAVIISRKATRPVVAKTTQEKLRQRKKWQGDLDKIGRRDINKTRRLVFRKEAAVLPDTAFDALALEFGQQGKKARPIWRVSTHRLVRSGIRELFRNKHLVVYPLTRLSYRAWMKWPPRTRKLYKAQQLKKLVGFEKRIAKR